MVSEDILTVQISSQVATLEMNCWCIGAFNQLYT